MRVAVLVVAGLLLADQSSFAAAAQEAPRPAPALAGVVGTVEAWDGKTLTVKTPTGTVSFAVPATAAVVASQPGKLADIGPGTFLGTTTLPRNGRLESIEIHVFPEAMRGLGEGHYPWQGEPGAMMTNGSVASMTNGNVAAIAAGGVMRVEYKDRNQGQATKDIYVPGDVRITRIEQVGLAALKPGQHVDARVRQAADGTATAAYIDIHQ